jgi:hypothetical protein
MSGPKKPSETGIRRATGLVQPGGSAGAPVQAATALAAAPVPAPQPVPPVRQRPVRFTLDLAPELHAYLSEFAAAAGADKSDVMRELLRQMRADSSLGTRVTAEVHRRQEALREAQRLAQE